MGRLHGVRIAMLGGDLRELVLVQRLHQLGAQLVLVGYPERSDLAGLRRARTVVEAVEQADVTVAPMSNTDEYGVIKAHLDPTAELRLDEQAFEAMQPGTPLFIGQAKPVVERLARRYQIPVVETAEHEEIAILNSIPTAEGAIARAMSELPITIHGSRSVVIGFGRCGMTLARLLHALGARTLVVARNPGQIARAYEMGLDVASLAGLEEAVLNADVVYNTVPALILTRSVLSQMRQDCLIIDVASAPGGTDFAAANEFGIKAFLDLGIPGRVAPKTAGEILAKVVPRLIEEMVGERRPA